MSTLQASGFYLERVGFEMKVNLRHNLKNGDNLVGRAYEAVVDIGINSPHCSQRHCTITVSDNSVVIKNLSGANGTFVNRVKIENRMVSLHERDIIGIVGGTRSMSELDGNYNYFVYRLCKYSNENLMTFEIDDDDPIEIEDDPVDDDVICLSDSDESIDSNEEHEVQIQLSRNFNMEIKQELQDIDDLEAICKTLKREPTDYFQINELSDMLIDREMILSDEVNDINTTEVNSDATVATTITSQTRSVKDSPIEKDEVNSNYSFPTDSYRDTSKPCCSKDIRDDTDTDSNDTVCFAPTSRTSIDDTSHVSGIAKLDLGEDDEETSSNCTDSDNNNLEDNLKETITSSKCTDSGNNNLKIKLKETVSKLISNAKTKRGAEIIDAKPLEKGRKTKSEEQFKKIKSKNVIPKEERKEMLRNISPKIATDSVKKGEKSITTPKVKYTPINRGAFLCDVSQNPILPGQRKRANKKPAMLLKRKRNSDDDTTNVLNIHAEAPKCNVVDDLSNVATPAELEQRVKESMATANDDGSDMDIDNLDDELSNKTRNPTHVVTTKESNFQVDPCHEIISNVTSYDPKELHKSDGLNRRNEFGLKTFADTYDDYDTYQGTLLPLLKSELSKEIEMEFTNAQIYQPTTVQVVFQNLEKRGSGKRMVFHCQAESLYKTKVFFDGYLVLASCLTNVTKFEFLAYITDMRHSSTAEKKTAYFTMETASETAKLIEDLKIKSLQIRPITLITNVLNEFRAVSNVQNSPLLKLVLNPLSGQIPSSFSAKDITYKGYTDLDENQLKTLTSIYKRCIKLEEPNVSLLDGAAGTGKSCMIVNLALQLTYGDELSRPLTILICSKSNKNIDEIALRLINVRDKTDPNKRIKLVRFGNLESMHSSVRSVSTQSLKENEPEFLHFAQPDKLRCEKDILELKIRARELDDKQDNTSTDKKVFERRLVRVNFLLSRLQGLTKMKLRDATTVILNSCEVICTTFGSIPKLKQYINNVDICIISQATQCNEALTLLPFQFGMPSLVLVGDSQQNPPPPYSKLVDQLNYGKSLFNRYQKLFLGKLGSPVYELHYQYRIHPAILHWPNKQFYKNRLISHRLSEDDSFPIMPYKVISYNEEDKMKESENIRLLIENLLKYVDHQKYTMEVICTNAKQNSFMQEKLRQMPFVSSNTADSYMTEKDVIIVWISREYGMSHLINQQILNMVVTRAKKCLIICGANLKAYKSRPMWRSLLEDAQTRNCLHHINAFSGASNKLSKILQNQFRNNNV